MRYLLILILSAALVCNAVAEPEDDLTATKSRLILETKIKNNDKSRMALDMGYTSLVNLNQVIEETPGGERTLPKKLERVHVTVYVPEHASREAREHFVSYVRRQIEEVHKGVRIKIKEQRVDVEAVEEEAREQNEAILSEVPEDSSPGRKLALWAVNQNRKTVAVLKEWGQKFGDRWRKVKNWRHWTTQSRDMLVGTLVGTGRSYFSITYWLGYTGVNKFGVAQALASYILDTVFSRYANRIEAFKGQHEIPFLKKLAAVRFYNESPVIKAFVINNLIGFSTNFYFRLMSWMNAPADVAPPISVDFLGSIAGGISIGGVAGAMGEQGAFTLRRKHIVSGRTEYYIYQVYGLMMQIEGLLLGSGQTYLFWTVMLSNSAIKFLIFLTSRIMPPANYRVLVMHPDIKMDPVVESIKYKEGYTAIDRVWEDKTKDDILFRLEYSPGERVLQRIKNRPVIGKLVKKVDESRLLNLQRKIQDKFKQKFRNRCNWLLRRGDKNK